MNKWTDKDGDTWVEQESGLLHRPGKAGCSVPKEYVEKMWGPLTPEKSAPTLDELRECSQDAEEHYALAQGQSTELIDAHADYISALEKANEELQLETKIANDGWKETNRMRGAIEADRDRWMRQYHLSASLNTSISKARGALRAALEELGGQ